MTLSDLIRERGRLLSLLDLVVLMDEFELRTVRDMVDLVGKIDAHPISTPPTDLSEMTNFIQYVKRHLPPFKDFCEKLGLDAAFAAAYRATIFLAVFESSQTVLLALGAESKAREGTSNTMSSAEWRQKYDEVESNMRDSCATVYSELREMGGRFRDQIMSRRFYVPATDLAGFIVKPLKDWKEEVISTLPESIKFVEQANRCRGFGMPSACAYFLICAIEHGLVRLQKNVSGLHSPPLGKETWGNWLIELETYTAKRINAVDKHGRKYLKKPPFHSAVSDVRSALSPVKDTRDYIGHSTLRPMKTFEDGSINLLDHSTRLILESVALTCKKKKT